MGQGQTESARAQQQKALEQLQQAEAALDEAVEAKAQAQEEAGRSLADAGKIKVVARLSSSGSATPQEGDWQVVSDIIDGRSGTLNLSLSIATPFRR